MRSSVRRGKKPSTLGYDEGVAREDYRHMMMPSLETSSLEMIEAEFALESPVGVFGSPLLFYETN